MLTQFLSRTSVLTQVLMGVIGLALMSQVSIPLKPVSITLQTVGVLFIGLTYSKREAIYTLMSYLTLGALGLPVFANYVGGIQHLAGPVGGFYFGFLLAVIVMASIRESLAVKPGILQDLALCLVGSAVLYTLGVIWLSNFIGLKAALTGGLMPFILPGILKSFILAGLLKYLRR